MFFAYLKLVFKHLRDCETERVFVLCGNIDVVFAGHISIQLVRIKPVASETSNP